MLPNLHSSIAKIDYLVKFYFLKPARFPETIHVAVNDTSCPSNRDHRGWLRAISPEEIRHAMMKAAARDVRAKLPMDEWRFCMLTTTMIFTSHNSDDSVYWSAAKLRQEIGAAYETMYPTSVGHLVIYKIRLRKDAI